MSGAAVLIRTSAGCPAANNHRSGRPFYVRKLPSEPSTLVVRAGGFGEVTTTGQQLGRNRNRARRRPPSSKPSSSRHPNRAAAGQHPGERQRHDARRDSGLACRRGRRCAAAGADVQPVPPRPAASPPSRPPRACRCAASGRAARAARWCCSTAFRSTIRSAAGSTGRACRSSAWTASKSPRTPRRASTATMPWAASSTSSPAARRGARSSSSRSTATTESPKFDFFASDAWNKVGGGRRRQFLQHRRIPDRGATRARADRQQRRTSTTRTSAAKLEYTPTDRVNVFFRAAHFTEDRVNGKVGEVNDTNWTTANGGVRMQLPDNSDLQARIFVDRQKAHFNFLAVTNPATTRNVVRLATDQHVPTNGVGGMVQWTEGDRHRRTRSAPAPTGDGWTATARKTATSPRRRPRSSASRRRRRCR